MAHRISVNEVSFEREAPLADDLAAMRAAELPAVGIQRDKLVEAEWTTGVAAVRESGLRVAYLTHRSMFELEDEAAWDRQSEELTRTIDAAVELGANAVYGTTGSPGRLTFEDGAERFVRAVGPAADHARSHGVNLMVEVTNPAFAHIDLLHTLRDSVEVAERAGIGVCIDLHACWTESGLRDSIARAAPLAAITQISDYKPGDETMNRSLPGEGIIPWDRLLSWVHEAGFDGWWDLELRGLAGDMSAARRAVGTVAEMLDRLPGR